MKTIFYEETQKMMNLKCHTDLVMKPSTIAGETYQIIDENDKIFEIINEDGELHQFTKDPNDEAYYGHWFELVEQQ